MRIYEICNRLYKNFYAMINRDNIESNGKNQTASKLESKSAGDFIHVRPGLGRSWEIKNLNAYCKHPDIKDAVQKFTSDLISIK